MNEDGESFGELVRASTRQEGYFASFVPVSAYENSQKNNELHYSRRKDVGNVQGAFCGTHIFTVSSMPVGSADFTYPTMTGM